MATYTISLSGHTARLNELMGHHMKAARLKRRDRDWLTIACRNAGVTPATGRRRVSLTVTLGPRQRADRADTWQKSLLDALVCAGALVDDHDRWLEWSEPVHVRGTRPGMRIVLEDIE